MMRHQARIAAHMAALGRDAANKCSAACTLYCVGDSQAGRWGARQQCSIILTLVRTRWPASAFSKTWSPRLRKVP